MSIKQKKILFVFGTRPEAIKMAPLIKSFQKRTDLFNTKICTTGQHREMLDQVLTFFDIKADYDLCIMRPDQNLFTITADVLLGLKNVIDDFCPDNIWVQGDTTTVMAASLAGFYEKIKISHLEAGLRSGNKYSPFPEEINRKITGHIADFHFAPTLQAVDNLKKENLTMNVWNVGNTVIDALILGLDIIKKNGEDNYTTHFHYLNFNKKIILVTGHRRESFGRPFEDMCNAIKEIALAYTDIEIIYPVHLNPNVKSTVNKILAGIKNIHLIEPLDYPKLIWLMNKSYMVLTDSGGIQEEAPSLGKPVLVMREVTERMEGVTAGTAKLVGTNKKLIVSECKKLIDDTTYYSSMANAINPYGDGTTSEKIVDIYEKLVLLQL